MTPNSENATARFLLAILNQKNLKDINWDQVASDPVLLSKCPNGHAARMRFARFKTSVMGHEPQKRNRTADSKTRVTKPKKPVKKETLVKPESLSSYAIKQESNQPYLAQFSPASTTSPYLNDTGRDDFNTRFLTPCSDDQLSANPAALEDLRVRNGFGASSMDCSPEFLHQPSHDHLGFHTFDAAYDMASYTTPHSPNDALEFHGVQPSLADDWADRFQDHHTF